MQFIQRSFWAAVFVGLGAGAAFGQAKSAAKASSEAKPMAVQKKTDAPAKALTEVELIAVLKKPAASVKEKADACRQLATVGTRAAVPVLAELLGDEKLDHMARYALEPIPDPAVDVALRTALNNLKGRPLVGVIGSIGVRRDAKAVAPLAQRLTDSNSEVAQAAARALGSIGTPEAGKALMHCLATSPPAANQPSLYEGLLRCAEALAAKGGRDEALAIYDQLQGGKRPPQIEAAAQHGAKLLRHGKDGDKTASGKGYAGGNWYRPFLEVGKTYSFTPASSASGSFQGEVLEIRSDSWVKVQLKGSDEPLWVNLNQILYVSDTAMSTKKPRKRSVPTP